VGWGLLLVEIAHRGHLFSVEVGVFVRGRQICDDVYFWCYFRCKEQGRNYDSDWSLDHRLGDFATSIFLVDPQPRLFHDVLHMEDAEKDQEDERLDIQAIYSTTINEFRRGLRQWLEKERDEEEENGDFEDRELDALLLKVSQHYCVCLCRSKYFKNNLICSIRHYNR